MKGPPSHPNSPIISIESTDEDIIERVGKLLGTKYSRHPARRANWKPTFRVQRKGWRAIDLMKKIQPFMGRRRKEQIQVVIDSYNPLRSRRVLLPEQVIEIQRRLSEGENYKDLAIEYGVKRSTIYNAKLNRHIYADVA